MYQVTLYVNHLVNDDFPHSSQHTLTLKKCMVHVDLTVDALYQRYRYIRLFKQKNDNEKASWLLKTLRYNI